MTGRPFIFYLTAIFAVLVTAAGMVVLLNTPAPGARTSEVKVEKGMRAVDVSQVLAKQGAIRSAFLFRVIARATRNDSRIRAGRYSLPPGLRTDQIVRFLAATTPRPLEARVTIAEGLDITGIASILARKAGVDSAAFALCALSRSLAESLGVDNATLEGYLYPDTYFIEEGAKAIDVARKMVGRFREAVPDSLVKRADAIGFTLNQAITLASLIETEAANDEERPIVSSVFHRRLEAGFPLQANPTVQYALGVKRRVYNGDLDVDSPYNTYQHPGLPPGPIANPGLKSILAALYPADTKYLYFVSNGEGGHVFSRTLSEHNTAVARYKKERAHRTR
jgi:UPF0755 protein